MKTTEPIGVLPGRPLSTHDMIMECVNYEARLVEAQRAAQEVTPPSKRMRMPAFHMTPEAGAAFGAQVYRFALSLVRI